VPTEMKGLSVIRVTDDKISPVHLLSKIFSHMKENQPSCFVTRHTSRVVPIEGTCSCTLDSVMRIANKLIPPHFHPPQKSCLFKVALKRRANNSFPRDQCTQALVKLINHDNIVDLKNPEKMIILEIFKSTAAMSVVSLDDFKFGFNIRSLMSSDTVKRGREEGKQDELQPNAKKKKNGTNK